jgi:hypothetical protein
MRCESKREEHSMRKKTKEDREKLLEEVFELALQNEMNYHG